MTFDIEQIENALNPLIGLKLSLASNTGNMRRFNFGPLRASNEDISGPYKLHLSCPWRIEFGDRIVTGSGDYYTE